MPKGSFVQEAASLTRKSADGTYRVVLITEGEGSSSRIRADVVDRSASVFEGVASFLNHPIDPKKPQLRPVESLAGRYRNVVVEDGPLGRQLAADFTPRAEYADFIAEFADILGLSVYCGADGEVLEDGRIEVEDFDAEDPYRSVDIVVAAGRGGRFKRAEESLRAIESSLGKPAHKPAVEASAEEEEGEHMDEKEMKALAVVVAAAVAESLKPVIDFVNESAARDAAQDQSEATAEALDEARAEGAKTAAEGFKAVDEAELPKEVAEALKAKVLDGETLENVTNEITNFKTAIEAFVKESAENDDTSGGTYVIESAGRRSQKKGGSFALKPGGRR